MNRKPYSFLQAPVFEDVEKTRVARWLYNSLLLIIVFLVAITLSLPFMGMHPMIQREFLIVQSILVILFAFFLFLAKRGYIWQVATATLVIIYLSVAYSHIGVYGTVKDLSIIGYFVLVPLTGLFFGRRVMWAAAIVSAVTLSVTLYAETSGYIQPFREPPATLEDLLFVLISLAMNTALTLALLTESEESAELAEESAAYLSQANQDLYHSRAALQKARDELEMRVIIRTEELNLTNQQLKSEIEERIKVEQTLRDAKEEAEAATRAKSEFLANMSHEIRTPMNAVTAMTSLLLETELTDDQQEFAQVIHRSSVALVAVINDILDFSRDESGKLTLDEEPYDIRVCIAEAFELLIPRAEEKGLELVYYVDDEVPDHVLGDVTRVRQILINLVSNAIKFTDRGEVYTYVTARPTDSNALEIQFDVIDSGIGIASSDMKSLFLPFSQIDSSSTRRYGGSGLGLAISKRLCERMDGHMWVTSEVGVGSTFHFTIIARQTDDNPSFEAKRHAELHDRTVLLISQGRTNREVLSSYLTRWGMTPIVINDANTCDANRIDEKNVDLAILDIDPTRGNDLELIDRLRISRPNLPAIIYISYSDGEFRRQLKDDNLTIALHKPINPSSLLAALQNCLGIVRQRQPVTSPIQSSAERSGTHGPLKILLVEDNLVNQLVTVRLLERLGYEPDLATTGINALDSVQQQLYDVILMDIHMPEMDGLDATRHIRADSSLAKQPYIIAITAAALQEEQDQCMAAGMDDFVAKPMRTESLANALERYWASGN